MSYTKMSYTDKPCYYSVLPFGLFSSGTSYHHHMMKPLTMTLHWLSYFFILTAYSLIRKWIAIGQILLARTELFELINAYVIKDL